MPFNEDGTRKDTMAYKKGPFTMKGSPMQRNFGISPLKEVTTWEKFKAGVKGVGTGISTAFSSSATKGAVGSTKKGIKKGKEK